MSVHHAVEGVAGAPQRGQGLLEGNLLEVQGDRLVLELGVEDEIDSRRLPQSLIGLA